MHAQSLQSLLPAKPSSPVIGEDMEEVHMVDLEGTRATGGGRSEAYEDGSDDEEYNGRHGQRMGCHQQ